MKSIVLTIISPKELPAPPKSGVLDFFKRPFPWLADARAEYLRVFTAVSCKFSYSDQVNGQAVMKPYPRALIDAAGCERHAWEYLVFSNEDEARAAGTKMGQRCFKYEIQCFWANAEAGVAGTGTYPRYANPYKNLLAFIRAFRAAAPTYTKLAYNGFSWSRTSQETGARVLHDAIMIKLFDIWSPMNYGTDPRSIEHFWSTKCFKYLKPCPRTPVIPTVGVGRVDKSGAVWGDWEDLRTLLLTTPVDGVNFFFGNGAKAQMLEGNPRHAPLVQAAVQLRKDWGA